MPFSPMQQLKREFFAMRNGVIADTMRRAGLNYRIIFGLTLPQISDIAKAMTPDADMARQLRDNKSTRESMLLAPMIFPREELTIEEARQWIDEAPTTEVIDVLCHRLLRLQPYAWHLATQLAGSPVERHMHHYAAMRMMWNLISTHSAMIRPIALKEAALQIPLTQRIAMQLVDEIDFLSEA